MLKTKPHVGPEDHGRRMSLEDFAEAEGEPGFRYELAKGRVVVSDIPGLAHGLVVQNLDAAMHAYKAKLEDSIYYVAGGSECALRLPGLRSERHPDLAIYLTAPADEEDLWEKWVPDIVIEVVSKGGEHRDYHEKREEYLYAGVREYWVVDPAERRVVVHTRRMDTWDERKLSGSQKLRTPLLPGFELEVNAVFALPKAPRIPRRRNGRREK